MPIQMRICSFCGQPSPSIVRENGKISMCVHCLELCKTLIRQSSMPKQRTKGGYACSFCGNDEYLKLIQGPPGVHICDSCCSDHAPVIEIGKSAAKKDDAREPLTEDPGILPGRIDGLSFPEMAEEVKNLAKKHSSRFSYGDMEYPVIRSEGFFLGLKELGFSEGPDISKHTGVEYARFESQKYKIECACMQKNEDDYYNITSHMTSVSIRDKKDVNIQDGYRPEGNIVRR